MSSFGGGGSTDARKLPHVATDVSSLRFCCEILRRLYAGAAKSIWRLYGQTNENFPVPRSWRFLVPLDLSFLALGLIFFGLTALAVAAAERL
ncbi:hypothetical protein [Blastochloris tepida]|uniref:hypothetical protein n=1 Tax=Blastochloris tepida TaxID=2233851 RepID=UPI000F82F35A|nr:hypothetical protein [Blastochloris tepida]